MESEFNKLSYDIQELIISKIHYHQPKALLNDIKNFVKLKRKILNIFKDIDDYFIIKYLALYYNNNYSYEYCYFSDSNISKMNRLFVINQNNPQPYKFYQYLCFHNFGNNTNNKRIINRYIGCLTPNERFDFLRYVNLYFNQ